jgi:hypothetical protein
MKKLLFVILLFASFNIFANSANISWPTPDTREDGSALNPSDIKGYQLFINGVMEPTLLSPGINTIDKVLQAGETCFMMRVVDQQNLLSKDSNVECYTLNAPPNSVTITITVIP